MKKLWTILFATCCFALFYGCNDNDSEDTVFSKKPKGLIEEDTLASMIAEQLLFESTVDFVKQNIEQEDTVLYSQINKLAGDQPISLDTMQMGSMYTLVKLSRTHYASWLHQHNVTADQYERSVRYYFVTPERIKHLMTKVQKILAAIPTNPEPILEDTLSERPLNSR